MFFPYLVTLSHPRILPLALKAGGLCQNSSDISTIAIVISDSHFTKANFPVCSSSQVLCGLRIVHGAAWMFSHIMDRHRIGCQAEKHIFHQAIIYVPIKYVTTTTTCSIHTTRKVAHPSLAGNNKALTSTRNAKQNKAQHQEGVSDSGAKWKTIPCPRQSTEILLLMEARELLKIGLY